jgi:hypothetical protein
MKVKMYRCPCCLKWSMLFRNRNKESGRSTFKHWYVRCPIHGNLFCIWKGRAKPQWLLLSQKEVEVEVED